MNTCDFLYALLNIVFLIVVVNFRVVFPDVISEDIGSVDVCIEQMNRELSEEIQVSVKTSQTASTASGIIILR